MSFFKKIQSQYQITAKDQIKYEVEAKFKVMADNDFTI